MNVKMKYTYVWHTNKHFFKSAMELVLVLLKIEIIIILPPSSALRQNLDKNQNLDKQTNSFHIQITFCYQLTFRI